MTAEIIAELAQGFEGKPEQTRLLLKAAAAAGADVAKYQLVFADELATPDYQYYDLFKSLEMGDSVWVDLERLAKELGIRLCLDIFGDRSLALAQQIDAASIKLHGTDIANVGLLNAVAGSSIDKVLLGAGGAHADEIRPALEILQHKQVVLLLGFQGYPTPNETNQIARVKLFIDQFGKTNSNVSIGFADHAPPDSPLGFALAATAVGAGAVVIEKHLTLAQIMQLEDHESALNPDQFRQFVQTIRGCAEAYGRAEDCNDYAMSQAEKDYRKMIRRHVVTTRALSDGTSLSPTDLSLKRTSLGNALTDLSFAYRKELKRDVAENSPLSPSDLD